MGEWRRARAGSSPAGSIRPRPGRCSPAPATTTASATRPVRCRVCCSCGHPRACLTPPLSVSWRSRTTGRPTSTGRTRSSPWTGTLTPLWASPGRWSGSWTAAGAPSWSFTTGTLATRGKSAPLAHRLPLPPGPPPSHRRRGYSWEWDQWNFLNARLQGEVPWMVAIGNHERNWPGSGDFYGGDDSGGECGVAYARRLPMPTAPGAPAGGPGDQPWYSFEFGPIHFLQASLL